MMPRHALLTVYRRLADGGLLPGTSGNASIRLPGGFLVTPSGVSAAGLRDPDLVMMDVAGRARGPLEPSSEWRLHRDLYVDRPDVGAVVHTHPPYATALACLRRDIPAFHYMVAVTGATSIRCAEYASFGTAELSESARRALGGAKACLLANHGAVAVGADLAEAEKIAFEVENLARTYLLALSVGQPFILDEAEMQKNLVRFETYGQRRAR